MIYLGYCCLLGTCSFHMYIHNKERHPHWTDRQAHTVKKIYRIRLQYFNMVVYMWVSETMSVWRWGQVGWEYLPLKSTSIRCAQSHPKSPCCYFEPYFDMIAQAIRMIGSFFVVNHNHINILYSKINKYGKKLCFESSKKSIIQASGGYEEKSIKKKWSFVNYVRIIFLNNQDLVGHYPGISHPS